MDNIHKRSARIGFESGRLSGKWRKALWVLSVKQSLELDLLAVGFVSISLGYKKYIAFPSPHHVLTPFLA